MRCKAPNQSIRGTLVGTRNSSVGSPWEIDPTTHYTVSGCSLVVRKEIHTLNTFYLRLYGVTHMIKNHSDRERGNPLLHLAPSCKEAILMILSPEVERSLMVRWCRRIDPSWGGPIELFLVPASAPRMVKTKAVVCVNLSVGWCI